MFLPLGFFRQRDVHTTSCPLLSHCELDLDSLEFYQIPAGSKAITMQERTANSQNCLVLRCCVSFVLKSLDLKLKGRRQSLKPQCIKYTIRM